ncbi:MAG: HAD family phosphatase [Clostridia bacterium]|nr:HAD family phosphatase [Clostridia bacterium]
MSDFSHILLATDLDGTFFGKDGRMVERNLAAVARLRAAGGRFTVATGRTHYMLRGSGEDLMSLVNAPIVFCNGAYLYDCSQRRAEGQSFFSERDIYELLAFTKDFPTVELRVAAPEQARVRELTGYIAEDARFYDEGRIWVDPNDEWSKNDCYKVVLSADAAALLPVRAALRARFGDRFENAPSDSTCMELMPQGVSKAAGLGKLREYYAQRGETLFLIACGDYENDLDMLRAADLAICPQNACDAAKRLAHAVLCHHDEGLIGDLVERLERGELPTLAARQRGCDA